MDIHINSIKTIKCRGIIFNDDKILVVKHSINHDFYALPGGHIER
jgi:ADP-ribose pyrophosphatase YjhB (NUDIX family)